MSHPSSNEQQETEEEVIYDEDSNVLFTAHVPELFVYAGFKLKGDDDLKRRICLNHELFGPVWERMLKEPYHVEVQPTISDFVLCWALETDLIERIHPSEEEQMNIEEYDKAVERKEGNDQTKTYFKVLNENFNKQKYFFIYNIKDMYWYDYFDNIFDNEGTFEQFKSFLREYVKKKGGEDKKLIVKSYFIGQQYQAGALNTCFVMLPQFMFSLFGFTHKEFKLLSAEQLIEKVCEDCVEKVPHQVHFLDLSLQERLRLSQENEASNYI